MILIAEEDRRCFMNYYLRMIFLFIFALIIYNCEIFHKRIYYYSNVDSNIRIPIGTKIYYSDLYVGRITTIKYFLGENEKEIEFYLFNEFFTLAKYNSKLIFEIDENNIIKRISIVTDSEDSFLLPERGYIDSIVLR